MILVLSREGRQVRATDALLIWLRREEAVFNVLTPFLMMLVMPGDNETISFRIFRDNVVMKLAMARLKHLRVCVVFDTSVVFILEVVAAVDQTGNVKCRSSRSSQP